MEENVMPEQQTPPKKKRGRKPSKERKGYFYETQENAVVEFISSDNEEERNKIFNNVLKPAFTKMIESIIRRYRLYPPDEEYRQTFDDTLSFLMSKLSYFDPATNYKAYSYCGTICKNYLIYKINQFNKRQIRNVSYDNPDTGLQDGLTDNVKYSYDTYDNNKAFISELTGATVEDMENMLENKEKFKLTENEVKAGMGLLYLMKNWEELFAQMGSNKFNKSSVLLFLKEYTNMNTKELRDSMRLFKKRYYEIKEGLLN